MTTKSDVLLALQRLRQAYERLAEGVAHTRDDLDRDGVVQRFEFTFELLWKTLKIWLEHMGVPCAGPRPCIKTAFRFGLVPDDEILLDMLEDRNRASHIYDEDMAQAIFEHISRVYVQVLEKVLNHLEAQAFRSDG